MRRVQLEAVIARELTPRCIDFELRNRRPPPRVVESKVIAPNAIGARADRVEHRDLQRRRVDVQTAVVFQPALAAAADCAREKGSKETAGATYAALLRNRAVMNKTRDRESPMSTEDPFDHQATMPCADGRVQDRGGRRVGIHAGFCTTLPS